MDKLETILARLREVGASLAENIRPKFGSGASEEALLAIERLLRCPLPSDFRLFLASVDKVSAMQVWNGYWLGGTAVIERSLARNDPPLYAESPEGRARVIPAGSDGGGNVWSLAVADADRVWKWNHENGQMVLVADNFVAFLREVAEDWQHFANGDSSWSYLSG